VSDTETEVTAAEPQTNPNAPAPVVVPELTDEEKARIQAWAEDAAVRAARYHNYCSQADKVLLRMFPNGPLDGSNHFRDSDGLDCDGQAWRDSEGYDRNNRNVDGYDRAGLDTSGYDKWGFNAEGVDRDGVHRDDPVRFKYNRRGFDLNGFNKAGFDRDGYARDSEERARRYRFDDAGFDVTGHNADGYNRAGEYRNRLSPNIRY
jgi:hypothetical protein